MNRRESLDALADKLDAEPRVWVRLALTKSESDWQVRVLEVTAGCPPPRWQVVRWHYPNARLDASVRQGKTVAKWLRARRLRVNGVTSPLTDLSETLSVERRESFWSWGSNEPLDWPSDDWRAPFTDQLNAFQDESIADGLSYFGRFDQALANLLGVSGNPRWSVPNRELAVRWQDDTARIRTVDVLPTTVLVEVDGTRLDGVQLELAGDIPGERRVLEGNEPRLEVFETPRGLSPSASLLVRTSDSWLDRKYSGRDFSDGSENRPFTTAEQAQITAHLEDIKAKLRADYADGLSEEQLDSLESDLDYAATATAWLGRVDWRNIVVGALFTRVFDRFINLDTAITVLKLIDQALPYVLRAGQAALPF